MPTKKSQPTNLPPEWRKAERLAKGIYRLQLSDSRHCYGFVFPDGTHTVFSSPRPISTEDLRVLYQAEVKGREMRRRMQEGTFDIEELERSQRCRWEEFKRLGLLLEREEDAALLDD